MKTVKLQVASYLFESDKGQVRKIPFHELSANEWVIYESGQPKYLVDFDQKGTFLVSYLEERLTREQKIETIITGLGIKIGKEWSIVHDTKGDEIKGSGQLETIDLFVPDSIIDFFLDVTFVATNDSEPEILFDDDNLFEAYLFKEDEYMGLESLTIEGFEEFKKMFQFLFETENEFDELASKNCRQVFDLTKFKNQCISFDELDSRYPEWINSSGRLNTMDEYGTLLGVIGYVHRNKDKQNLFLIAEKRKYGY